MRIGLFTDIHGNREALDSCLEHAAAVGIDRHVFLGDLVGYGPDPAYIVDRVRGLVETGAIVIRGNHDDYAVKPKRGMSEMARIAIEWTHKVLDAEARAWLGTLPFSAQEDDRLYVHASAAEPPEWHYIDNRAAAEACLAATAQRLIFCGHTHVPALFHSIGGRPAEHFRPLANKPVPLLPARRWVTVVGAVGQPRDRNPNACWGLLDTDEKSIAMMRVPYEIDETLRKINAADLPEWLGIRLKEGR